MAIALTKRDVDLDDAQVQSILHQLRHEGSGLSATWDGGRLRQAQDDLIHRLNGEIASDPSLTPGRAESLRTRLLQGANQPPDAATLHAVDRLRLRANHAEHSLRQRLRESAARLRLSVPETRREFDRLRSIAPKGRQARANPQDRVDRASIPLDPRTRHALADLETRAAGAPPAPRVVTTWSHVGADGIDDVGYDRGSGRLEYRMEAGHLEAFHNVAPALAARATEPNEAFMLYRAVSTHSRHRYQDRQAERSAGMAVRCEVCGQFAGTPHRCPDQAGTLMDGDLERLSSPDDVVTLRAAGLSDARAALERDGAIRLPVLARVLGPQGHLVSPASPEFTVPDAGTGMVRGEALIRSAEAPDVSAESLACDCPQGRTTGRCRHISIVGRVLAVELAPLSPEHAHTAGEMYESIASAERGGHQYRLLERTGIPDVAHPPLDPDVSTFRYSQDPEAFADDVRAARPSKGPSGDPAEGRVPLLREDPVFYGYGAGRRFGFEVEYTVDSSNVPDLGSDWRDEHYADYDEVEEEVDGEYETTELNEKTGEWETVTLDGPHLETTEVMTLDGDSAPSSEDLAIRRIGWDLESTELTSDSDQHGYGSSQNYGYSERWWSHEQDSTVDGEIVSPILRDQPEAWAQLEQVCQIVRGAGGDYRRASAHVSISADEFGGDPERLSQLLRMVRENEDDLYRMAHTPGSQRGVHQWAAPLPPTPDLGYMDVDDAQMQLRRESAVNIGHVGDAPSSHDRLEFRLFDASLEPGRMQAQAKLAAALVDYASRHPRQPTGPARPMGEMLDSLGTGKGTVGLDVHPDLMGAAEWAQRTEPVRQLIDRLFRRDVDKRQAAALWAVGRYRAAT